MNERIDIDYSVINSLPELLRQLHKKAIPDNLHWYYVSAYQERKARVKGIPLSGQFELTPICNLDCKMCYVHLNKEQLNGASLLPVDQWKCIITQAHELGMINATLTGGECLTYTGFDELYLYLRNLGVKTSIKTNGTLLDNERLAFFDKYPPHSLTVSLYGSSDKAYQSVTGHAVFNTVYDSLVRLKKADYLVSIAITPSKYMYNDIEAIIDLVTELKYPWSINVVLFPPRKETGRKLCDLTIDEYVEVFKLIGLRKTSPAVPVEEIKLPECSKNDDVHYGINCGAGRSCFTVNWMGLLSACENLDSLRVSLLEKPFSEAWKQINANAVSYPLPMECSNCEYDKICFSCAAYRGLEAKAGHCNPSICERTKLFIKEGIYSI